MNALEVISDPVRLSLVRHLERHAGASLHDLADAADVHLNTARQHVAALEEAGAIVRESGAPSGPGRPAARYRLAPGWTMPTSDFRGLAELLAAALVRSGAGPDEVASVGREWGRYLLGRPGEHDVGLELPRALEQLGFSARMEDQTLELSACPCSLMLPDRPELICELAVAVADGVLTGSGSGLETAERSHDPATRACSVRIRPRRRAVEHEH
jgi:predicted ArsR family transcriptional regulator